MIIMESIESNDGRWPVKVKRQFPERDGGVSYREDEILTSREACELLKIGRTKLWRLTKDSDVPAYRVGDGKTSGLRYRKSELLAYLDKNRV